MRQGTHFKWMEEWGMIFEAEKGAEHGHSADELRSRQGDGCMWTMVQGEWHPL